MIRSACERLDLLSSRFLRKFLIVSIIRRYPRKGLKFRIMSDDEDLTPFQKKMREQQQKRLEAREVRVEAYKALTEDALKEGLPPAELYLEFIDGIDLNVEEWDRPVFASFPPGYDFVSFPTMADPTGWRGDPVKQSALAAVLVEDAENPLSCYARFWAELIEKFPEVEGQIPAPHMEDPSAPRWSRR